MARTARQLAASRRNIVAAQRASANSRRGKKRSRVSGHHYGTGKTGRRQARRNKYGSRKHGISIAQQTRRDRRSRRRGAVVTTAVGLAGTGFAIYGNYHNTTTAEQRKKHRVAAKAVGKDFKKVPKQARLGYHTGRGLGLNRRKSARVAGKMAKGQATGKFR